MDAERIRSATPTSQQGNETGSDEAAPTSLLSGGRKPAQDIPLVRREGSLTLSATKDDFLDDEEEKAGLTASDMSRIPNERTRRNRFPRKVPVIDTQTAQASVSVGPYDRALRPPSPVHPEMRVVWTGDLGPAVLNYLTFCRQLLGKGHIPVTEPLEEDEQALEFLQEHGGNDVERAKLMLISSMGGGAEVASVSLEQINESRTRPRTKGVFKSWVGGEYAQESEGHPDASNPTKLKALWKDWTSRCKKALSQSQSTANDLLALQHEEHQLPRFQSRGSEEDNVVSAANETSIELDTRLSDILVYVAEVHDALSLVQPAKRLTAAALKKLAEEAPKKIQMKEVELVKDLVAKSEYWEKRAAKWLTVESSEEDQNGAAPVQTSVSPTLGVSAAAPAATSKRSAAAGGSSTANRSASVNGAAQEFTLAELSELIREGSESQVDHSSILQLLIKKRNECEHLLKRAALHVPQDKSWRQNRKKYEILPLAKMKQFREELKRTKLKLVQIGWLDTHIATAEEWIAAVKKATSVEKCTIKELNTLLSKADQIPVDLTEEKKSLEKFLEKAQDWVKRAKAFFPPTRSSAIVVGAVGKKTRATLAADPDSTFQKGTSEDFLALRDEAKQEGFDGLVEASAAMEAAETVEDWIERVNDALRGDVSDEKLAALNTLLEEADQLPVIVAEERALRQAASMMEWSRKALQFIRAPQETVKLIDMENHIAEADRLFPDEAPLSNKRKKIKRTTVLENEVELRAVVDEARAWIDRANLILQPSLVSAQKFESLDELKQLLAQRTRANISDVRKAAIEKVRDIGAWQKRVREALVATKHFAVEQVEVTPTYDSILDASILKDTATPVEDEEDDNQVQMDVATSAQPEAQEDQKMDGEDTNNKLSLDDLREMLFESQRMGVRVPEHELLAQIDSTAKAWFARFSVVILEPAASAVATGAASSAAGAPPSSSKAKPKKRGKTGQGDDAFLPTPARFELTVEDLAALRDDAEQLPVDLSKEIEDLNACLRATKEWRELCEEALENYRGACRGAFRAVSIPAEDPENEAFAGANERATRRNLLQALRLVVFDERGHEKFPAETEKQNPWWREEYPDAIRLAMQEMADAMKDAEARRLHLIALDSAPVRACAWLIQADAWIQQLRSEFFPGQPGAKALHTLCQAVLTGTKVLMDKEAISFLELPDVFPIAELEDYAIPPMPTAAPTTTTVTTPPATANTASMHPPASTSKRARMAVSSESPNVAVEAAAAAPTVVAPVVAEKEEWRILRYAKAMSPSEAEGNALRMNYPSVSGIILRRLFGLKRVSQAALASRGQAKRMNQTPRPERSQARLKQLMAQSLSWTTSFYLEEETRFRYAMALSEAWSDEKKRTMAAKKSSVDQLEKLAERGERVWIDLSVVDSVRKQAELAKAWLQEYAAKDQSSASIAELTLLLERGEKIQGVDLGQELDHLRRETEVFCMCRGPRDDAMFKCQFCKDVFHIACMGASCFANACHVCIAARAADHQAGIGIAAMARIQALESALSTSHVTGVDGIEQAKELCEWQKALLEVMQTSDSKTINPDSISPASPKIRESVDVKLIRNGLEAKYWRSLLETVRYKPKPETLRQILDKSPLSIPREALVGLQDIATRAEHAKAAFDKLWNATEEEPAESILMQCHALKPVLETIPVDFREEIKRVDACVECAAQRYCICRKFDDGNPMIACDVCSEWYHTACLGMGSKDESRGDFVCDRCKNGSSGL